MSEEIEVDGGMGLDEFLGHKTGGGSGGEFLENWKDEGQIRVWMHTRSPLYAHWFHGWHAIVEVDDKETGEKVRKVYGRKWGCHERELVLRKQYFRDRGTGEREYPPEVCPSCLLGEYVRGEVAEGRMSWVDPIFKFEGDDPDDEVLMLAGHLYNAFNAKDLTRAQISEMRKAGVRRDETWKQNWIAKCQYVFAVVNADDLSAGCKVARESTALGNAIKKAIRDTLKQKGPEKGSPIKHPYPFEWNFDDSKDFEKKYDVTALPDIRMTDEVRQLIVTDDPPDLSITAGRGNCLLLRASMEEHLVDGVSIPFDKIFGPAEERGLMKGEIEKRKGAGDDDDEEAEEPKTAAVRRQGGTKVPEAEDRGGAKTTSRADAGRYSVSTKASEKNPSKGDVFSQEAKKRAGEKAAKPEDDDKIRCDYCKVEVASDCMKCPACGTEYEEHDGSVVIAALPCKGCKAPIVVPDENPAAAICEKCATVHDVEFDDDGDLKKWEARSKPAEEAKTASRTGRRVRQAQAEK